MPQEVEKRGHGVFDIPGKWDTLIELVRSGMGGYEAMEHMGHSWRTLNRYMKANPEAREEFVAAKREAREEPAMRILMSEMENADSAADRISAADKVLRHSAKDMENVIRHEHQHIVNPEQIADIQALRDLAASRRAAEDVIDVDSEEVPPAKELT